MPEEQVNGANSSGAADGPPADRAALEKALEIVSQHLPGAGVEIEETPPEGALKLDATHLVLACRVLKEDAGLRFTMPLFCTAVDWLDREPRFDLVYQLRSLHLQAAIRVKVGVEDRLEGLPKVPSLTGIWKGMGYLEREVYDLFGIEFEGHPDLRRILMPVDWEGYPLRKDYVSFGEPVKFTDRGSFPPDAAVPQGSEQ